MKHRAAICFVAAAMIVLLFGCGGQISSSNPNSPGATDSPASNNSSSGAKTMLNFATATTTGIYYPLGAAMSKMWNDKIPNVSVSSQATNGSVQNLNFMQQKESQIALTQVGTLVDAYEGNVAFKDRPYKDVRVIASLYPSVEQIVVRDGINSVADLKGKRFVPGPTASQTEIDAQRILAEYGLSYKDIKPQFVGFTEATDLMRNKQADGGLILAGYPNAAVTEMLTTANAHLISLDEDKIDELIKKYPLFIKYTIPAGTYDGQNEDIITLGQNNILVVDASMPEDLAYEMTKVLWENLDALEGTSSVVKMFNLENATQGLSGVPLHPGAEKYYKEKGVIK
jgi:hypothetical protein